MNNNRLANHKLNPSLGAESKRQLFAHLQGAKT